MAFNADFCRCCFCLGHGSNLIRVVLLKYFPLFLFLGGSIQFLKQQKENLDLKVLSSPNLFPLLIYNLLFYILQIVIGKSDNVTLPIAHNSFKIEKNAKKAIIASDVAIVASGTATLECAIEGTPLIVCYKVSSVTWLLAKFMVKVKYSSIVNLIAGKKIVPEFLQSEMNPFIIKNKLLELIDEKSKLRKQMIEDFVKVKNKLGTPGVYSKIANEILKATKL